ncbi:hypothetical protein, partial [Levilactobacillus tujiorum]|uniref:hypothetical protein n=1 Tax=Levilactobacillus tujiorum TaxID=2912243 RepID=UPI001F1163FF
FRFHLAMDTLAFGSWFRLLRSTADFHRLVNAHAGRTRGIYQVTLLVNGAFETCFSAQSEVRDRSMARAVLPTAIQLKVWRTVRRQASIQVIYFPSPQSEAAGGNLQLLLTANLEL